MRMGIHFLYFFSRRVYVEVALLLEVLILLIIDSYFL